MILQTQKETIPLYIKGGKGAKKPSWLKKGNPGKPKGTERGIKAVETRGSCQGGITSLAHTCSESVRKDKAERELRLGTNIKDNQKSFRYIGNKRKAQGRKGPLQDKLGHW